MSDWQKLRDRGINPYEAPLSVPQLKVRAAFGKVVQGVCLASLAFTMLLAMTFCNEVMRMATDKDWRWRMLGCALAIGWVGVLGAIAAVGDAGSKIVESAESEVAGNNSENHED